MKIGIPKAFLYYRYIHLWETFFTELGCEVVVSPDTNKEIINKGTMYAIDESCLSSKIYLGHVEYLIDKCDYILIPRIANFGGDKHTVCSRFQAMRDVCYNTFKDRNIKILDYNIHESRKLTEEKAFFEMGKTLGKKKKDINRAYHMALQAEKDYNNMAIKQNQDLLANSKRLKILVVAHPYNIYDSYIGKPILEFLEQLNCDVIMACESPRKKAYEASLKISKTLPWTFNQELVGSIELYKENIDGIILISAFPCGPDSLVNEIIIRRVKDKPILNLILDNQDGNAGIETRLESFIDIINIKKEM